MIDDESIKETAKAAQEIAKAAGKTLDFVEKFGSFISKITAGPIEQSIGIFEDKLKYMRFERQLRLIQESEKLIHQMGFSGPTKSIPLKIAIPLFQAASLEDDDRLQDLWVNLLVNGSIEINKIELTRTFIDILERLTPLEAKILNTIYSLPFNETHHNGIFTKNLPDHAEQIKSSDSDDSQIEEEPSVEVKLALVNLARQGCISFARSWGGGEFYSRINPTLLGRSFVDACTIRL